jgi:flavorubredoxin
MKSFLIYLLCISFIFSKPIKEDLGNGIFYIGVNDNKITLFEGQYPVEHGMAYNSYLVRDGDEIAIIDTVDKHFKDEWLENIKNNLENIKPKYLIVQHMEPDHSACIDEFVKLYPDVTVVSSKKAFVMMNNFFHNEYKTHRIVVKEGDSLKMGKHTFTFVEAPMVHWPEVIVTYESLSKTLFSADGFGKFGSNSFDEDWDDESRRYFIGIVGKYGKQVQNLLKKASGLDIKMICPTHGPVLTENLGHYLSLYNTWSSYEPEEDGIAIVYTSIYGHTRDAVELLEKKLKEKGATVVVHDLTKEHVSYAVADAFKYSQLVLATTSYTATIFPAMNFFIEHLVGRNFQNRNVAFIENGSWAVTAKKVMVEKLKECDLTYAKQSVTIKSALCPRSIKEIESLANELAGNRRIKK